MSMREVDSYLKKIDLFFRRDEIKIEAKENKLYWSELIESNDELQTEDWLIKMERIRHETKYNLFLKSSSAMIYATFERSLYSVVQAVTNVTEVNANLKKYKKKSKDECFSGCIGTYILYLIEVHNVDWDGLEKMWGRIDDFRFVRNKIIHEGGELEEGDWEQFDKIAAEEYGLSRDGEIILLDLFYLTGVVDVMKEFLDALCRRLDGRVFIK